MQSFKEFKALLEKKGLYHFVNKRKKDGTSRDKDHPDAPSDEDFKNAAKTAKESKKYSDGTTYRDSEGKTHKRVSSPGTSRGDSYCARSYGQMKDHPSAAKDPDSKLRQRRRAWGCRGKSSSKK